MRNFLAFLKSKIFLLQLLLAILLFVGIYFGLNAWMHNFTNQGESVELPNIKGKNVLDAEENLGALGLKIEVIDSVYTEDKRPGEIVKQIPDAFQRVKSKRTVYAVINSFQAPLVALPNVINQSRRESISTLEALGFKITEFEYQPDICTDCILEVLVNNKSVKKGLMLPKGTALKVVLGKGVSEEYTRLPYLVGKTLGEAISSALENTLNVGALIYEDCKNKEDSAKAVVIRQNPEFIANSELELRLGSEIDLWLSPNPDKLKMLSEEQLQPKPQSVSQSTPTSDEDFSR